MPRIMLSPCFDGRNMYIAMRAKGLVIVAEVLHHKCDVAMERWSHSTGAVTECYSIVLCSGVHG